MNDRSLDRVFRETLRLFSLIWLITVLLFPWIYFLKHGGVISPPPFFYLNALNAVILLIYLSVDGIDRKMGRRYIPFAVMLATVLPLLFFYLAVWLDASHRMVDSVQTQFSVFPMQFIVLLLVALSYRLRVVNSIAVFLTLLNLLLYALFPMSKKDWMAFGASNLIRLLTVLTATYLVNRISSYLKERTRELEKANLRLKELAAARQSLTESRERNRLARELHDTLAHTLSGLSVQLEAVKAYWQADPDKSYLLLEESIGTARNGLNETRRALKALRSIPVENMGFLNAVREMARDFESKNGFYLDLQMVARLPELDPHEEDGFYRILQEALHNIDQHSMATRVKLEIGFADGILHILLEDNGRGFDVEQSVKEGHFGIKGMYERAEILGSKLKISSEIGKGTSIEIFKEIKNEDSDL